VLKVEKDGTMYAMKEMLKARVSAKKSIESVCKELELMCKIESDFIVNVHYAFTDPDYLYLVMDLMEGGDLRFHITKHRKFSSKITQFFIACLIQALEAVHEQGIIHRDIKPENLVFDSNGYLRLTDFGIAREWSPDNHNETSGTPGYMAPEVLFKQNHGIAADYFAVGVIGYECIMGRRPYTGRSRKDIRNAIMNKQVTIKQSDIPAGYPIEAADFVN
jgi:serine/threonine protein kinase